MRLDVLGLEGSSSLGWNLLPEIKTLIRNFTSDIIEEIAVQVCTVVKYNGIVKFVEKVQDDNWKPFVERHTRGTMLWPPGILYNPATQSLSK